MTIKPLFDYIVVDAKEKQETTKGGLILTAASAEKYTTAKVIAVGNGGNLYGKDLVITVPGHHPYETGEKHKFGFDLEALHFFDAETELRIN